MEESKGEEERGTEALGEGGVGDGADADGLEGAEEEIGDELGHGGRGEVDAGAAVPGLLLGHGVGHADLEEVSEGRGR